MVLAQEPLRASPLDVTGVERCRLRRVILPGVGPVSHVSCQTAGRCRRLTCLCQPPTVSARRWCDRPLLREAAARPGLSSVHPRCRADPRLQLRRLASQQTADAAPRASDAWPADAHTRRPVQYYIPLVTILRYSRCEARRKETKANRMERRTCFYAPSCVGCKVSSPVSWSSSMAIET